MQSMEGQFDACTEDLFNQTVKLEEMEKKAGNAESDVSALRSRLILLQENNEKQEEISRKMATLDADAARGNERADGAEKKIMDLEEELKVVGQNLQQLEIGEEQRRIREEQLQGQIMDLRNKLKASEYRGEQAEMNIQRLNVRIDQVEEDLLQEKLKIKKVSDDLNQTFDDMLEMAC